MWSIRKIIHKGDYLYALVPEHPKATKNGYVLLHRVVMENKIGRLLESKEQVHHIDGNRYNNAPENLELTRLGEHQKFHRQFDTVAVVTLVCSFCGKTFVREKRRLASSTKHFFCTRSCNGKFNGFKSK